MLSQQGIAQKCTKCFLKSKVNELFEAEVTVNAAFTENVENNIFKCNCQGWHQI